MCRGMASSMTKYLPIDIEETVETKIKGIPMEGSDNVTADLTGESAWIVNREKLDKLLLDKALSNGAMILQPAEVNKITMRMDYGR